KLPSLRVLSTLHVAAVFPETSATVGALLARSTPICFTTPSGSAAASYPHGAGRIRVVPNGIEVERIAFRAEAPRDGRLIWSGRRSREKGLKEALAIADRLNRPITIAGAPALEEAGAVDPVAACRLADDRGLVPRRAVPALLGDAAVTLVTSSIAES